MRVSKMLLIIIGTVCVGVKAVAQSDYLCLYSWNQEESLSYSVQQVRKLVFTDTEVSISLWGSEDTYTLPYGSVRKITFEDEPLPSVVDAIQTQNTTMYYDVFQKSLVVTSVCSNGLLQLYNINGSLAFSTYVPEYRSEHSLATLPSGIYIAKLTDQTDTYILKLQIK